MTEDSKKDEKAKNAGAGATASGPAGKADGPGPGSGPAKPPGKDAPKGSAASTAGARPPSPPQPAKKKSGGAVMLWTLLILVLIGVGGYFSWPMWSPYAIPYLELYLPDLAKAPEEDPKIVALGDRLNSLEQLVTERQADAGVIAALEQERERLQAELAAVMQRVGKLEKALGDVRRVAETAALPAEAADASESLGKLIQRVANLEGRTQTLAGKTAEVDEISRRVGTLEASAAAAGSSAAAAASVASAATATVLAVSQLRTATEGGGSFSAELEALKAVGGGDAELAKAVAALEPHAGSGVSTVADLANRFSAVAADVVHADSALRGEGWMEQAVNRVTSLVNVRRTGSRAAAAGGVEAAVARAEELLAGSDLAAAVDALAGLEGPAAEAASAWLDEARARLAVEKTVATLQVRAVALVSASGK